VYTNLLPMTLLAPLIIPHARTWPREAPVRYVGRRPWQAASTLRLFHCRVRLGSSLCPRRRRHHNGVLGQGRLGRRRGHPLRLGWHRSVRRRLRWPAGLGPLGAHGGSLAPVSMIVVESSRPIVAGTRWQLHGGWV